MQARGLIYKSLEFYETQIEISYTSLADKLSNSVHKLRSGTSAETVQNNMRSEFSFC